MTIDIKPQRGAKVNIMPSSLHACPITSTAFKIPRLAAPT